MNDEPKPVTPDITPLIIDGDWDATHPTPPSPEADAASIAIKVAHYAAWLEAEHKRKLREEWIDRQIEEEKNK